MITPSTSRFDISERVILITGGCGLLGQGYAEIVIEYGGIPILLDVNKRKGKKVAESISGRKRSECLFLECDVTDEEAVIWCKNKVLSRFGRIDVLINNAAIDPKVGQSGVMNSSRLENFSIDQWNLELSVGLTGAMICSKVFGQEMSRDGGVILNISSDLGLISPDQRLYRKEGESEDSQSVKPVTYSVIKHGVIGLTKYLATYWPTKVRSNALCPGGVYAGQSEEFVNKISTLIPLGRMATKEEYKEAVIFLISDASSYMNGAVLNLDGGRSTW